MKRNGEMLKLIGFVALSFLLLSCGGSEKTPITSSSTTTNESYTVYKQSQTKKGAETAPDVLVVLPAEAQPTENLAPVPNAQVTFLQTEATSDTDTTAEAITVTTDQNGEFSIPDEVQAVSQSEEAQPEVVVSDPTGEAASVSTTLPVAAEDTGEAPLSLKVVPETFRMLQGEVRVFHALKVLPNGKVVRAKNVDWNCDAKGNGVLSEVTNSRLANDEYVVCQAVKSGEAEVKASIQAGGGLSASARGQVESLQDLVKVTGTVVDASGERVGKGYVVNFDLPPVNGLKPFHFAGPTNENGEYTVYLPAPTDPAGTLYQLRIGDPTAKELYEAEKVNPDNDPLNTYRILPQDAGTTKTDVGLKIGKPFQLLPPPPPVARILHEAWQQVRGAIQPRFFEPFHGVRLLFESTETSGQNTHRGMFYGWCFEKSSDSKGNPVLLLTPPELESSTPPSCPNSNAQQKITATRTAFTAKESAAYAYVKYLKPMDLSGASSTDFKKVREGTVNDTFTCDTQMGVERCYISAIDVIARHFPLDNDQTPLSTTVFSWRRTLASGEEGTDKAVPSRVEITEKVCSGANEWNDTAEKKCGEGIPFVNYKVTRTKNSGEILFPPDGTSLLFSFDGNSSHYVRRPDGEVKEIKNTFSGELNTDHSGKADIETEDGRVKIHFDLLPFQDSTTGQVNDNLATGTMTLTLAQPDGSQQTLLITFTVSRFGRITITYPGGKVEGIPI